MKNNVYLAGIACLIWVMCGVSCSKKKDADVPRTTLDLPDIPYDYEGILPGIGQLGRVLFYDKTLSVNNAISCGTCHKQAFAFSDNTALSTGFENMKTSRNAPPIQNLAPGIFIIPFPIPPGFSFNTPLLFWDGRESVLKTMVLRPVFNHVEMGARTTTEIVSKLKERPYYANLFAQAFGDNEITFDRVAVALSSFTGSITSNSSKFDLVGINGLNTLETQGLDLFFGKYDCGSCHSLSTPNGYSVSTGSTLLNIGLNADYSDNGLGALNGNPADNGKFKIPSLRNVVLTGPYMHDGRFASLDEVLEHYSSGIKNHPNLDDRLKDQNGNAKAMNIKQTDKNALIAFLNSLTDNKLTTEPKFSDPFKVN